MTRRTTKVISAFALVAGMAACGHAGTPESTKGIADVEPPPAPAAVSLTDKPYIKASDLPMPTDPQLVMGRAVWEGNCQTCHGRGAEGSPKITNKKAWAPRIAKGMDVLEQHALNGFFGEMGTEMPARGGNKNLTDAEVRAAVAYMVSNSK